MAAGSTFGRGAASSVEGFKKTFFDRDKVLRAVDRMQRRQLSKLGAFVRQRAKTSIRTRKKVSDPGQPPSSHVGLLKKFIFFGYEPAKKNVVIGPAFLSGKRHGALTQPEALEYGGATVLRRRGKPRLAHYRARPFMRPALAAELPKWLRGLKDTVR